MDPNAQHGITTLGPLLASMVHDSETGELRWPVIVSVLAVAAVVAVGGFIIKIGNEVSANTAIIVLMNSDIKELKSSLHPATSKRYTSDDAARDLELIRQAMREMQDQARRDHEDNSRRISKLEDKR